LITFYVTHAARLFLAICMIFSGMVGETIHHYYRTRSR
jgi:nitric oxide reductase large subunit